MGWVPGNRVYDPGTFLNVNVQFDAFCDAIGGEQYNNTFTSI